MMDELGMQDRARDWNPDAGERGMFYGIAQEKARQKRRAAAKKAARTRRRNRAKDAHPDVEALLEAYRKGGKSSANAEFDRIARARKMKDYEALLLAEAFRRELAKTGGAKDARGYASPDELARMRENVARLERKIVELKTAGANILHHPNLTYELKQAKRELARYTTAKDASYMENPAPGTAVSYRDPHRMETVRGTVAGPQDRRTGQVPVRSDARGTEMVHFSRLSPSRTGGRDAMTEAEARGLRPGDTRVVWTDRDYGKNERVFRNDPQGAPGNALARARKLADRLRADRDVRTVRIVEEARYTTAKDALLGGASRTVLPRWLTPGFRAEDKRAAAHRALDRVMDALQPHQVAASPSLTTRARRLFKFGGSGEVSLGFIIKSGERLANAIQRGEHGLVTDDLRAVEELVRRAKEEYEKG